LGTVTLAGGIANLTTTTLPVGSDPLTATYSGATSFFGSTSATVTEVVHEKTTTTLTSSLNPAGVGKKITFTAKVHASISGTPTGTVTFKNGATTLGTATLSSGTASFATTTLTVGTHSITAVYGGSSTYAGSTSAALSQVVH